MACAAVTYTRTDGQVESEQGPGRESHTNSAVKSFIMSAMVLY